LISKVDALPAEMEYVPKHGFNYYKSHMLDIENLKVDAACVMGEPDRGFH
jgi:hypothetical protein